MEPLVIAFSTAFGAIIVKVADYITARRLGLGSMNERLVDTLQATVSAQASQIAAQAGQIASLTDDLRDERRERNTLADRVRQLEHTVAEQARAAISKEFQT